MKITLPLLFIFYAFSSNSQSCNHIIYPPAGNATGGYYHVHNDSTINSGDGLSFYICSGAHLTVNLSSGNSYFMEDNSQLTINDHDGDAVFAKGNCTIIDNTIEGIMVNKEASSTFSKPNMPSAAIVLTCPNMVFDYNQVGGSSPCGQVNGIPDHQEKTLTTYPNPLENGGALYFSEEISDLRLFNLNGELVFESFNIENDNIQLPKVTAGLYIAKVSSKNNGTMHSKVIIQ